MVVFRIGWKSCMLRGRRGFASSTRYTIEYRPGDYETWKYVAPIQRSAWTSKAFESGTWGGEIRPEFTPRSGEIVAQEHWCSSGFANTDLDLLLKKHGIHK